jgi:hypothetical protein
MRKGFDPRDVRTIERSFDSNQQEFRVIKTSSKDREIVLAILTRDGLGFWTVTSVSGEAQADPHLESIGWIRGGGVRRFSHSEDPDFSHEWNLVYYGNNAIQHILFRPGQLPENVAVNIQQAGEEYLIHIISFADPEVLNSIDIPALLEENHSIAQE